MTQSETKGKIPVACRILCLSLVIVLLYLVLVIPVVDGRALAIGIMMGMMLILGIL